MSNLIPVITQEEYVIPPIYHPSNLTMVNPISIPTLPIINSTLTTNATVTLPLKSSKNLLQPSIQDIFPSKNDFASIPPANSFHVSAHWRKYKNTAASKKSTKKSTKKASQSKKKRALKSPPPTAVADDCKESVQLAHSLHIQEIKDLVNSF